MLDVVQAVVSLHVVTHRWCQPCTFDSFPLSHRSTILRGSLCKPHLTRSEPEVACAQAGRTASETRKVGPDLCAHCCEHAPANAVAQVLTAVPAAVAPDARDFVVALMARVEAVVRGTRSVQVVSRRATSRVSRVQLRHLPRTVQLIVMSASADMSSQDPPIDLRKMDRDGKQTRPVPCAFGQPFLQGFHQGSLCCQATSSVHTPVKVSADAVKNKVPLSTVLVCGTDTRASSVLAACAKVMTLPNSEATLHNLRLRAQIHCKLLQLVYPGSPICHKQLETSIKTASASAKIETQQVSAYTWQRSRLATITVQVRLADTPSCSGVETTQLLRGIPDSLTCPTQVDMAANEPASAIFQGRPHVYIFASPPPQATGRSTARYTHAPLEGAKAQAHRTTSRSSCHSGQSSMCGLHRRTGTTSLWFSWQCNSSRSPWRSPQIWQSPAQQTLQLTCVPPSASSARQPCKFR